MSSLLLFGPSTDWNIHAVECWHPAVVVEAYVAAGCVLVDATATHPVSRPIRQRLTEGLIVPAAQRHVAAAIPLLALLAGVVTVTGVRHPQRVSGPHAIHVNDESEVAAGALKSGEAACRQQGEDLDQQMMREQSEKRLRLQQLLQPLSYFQERTRLCSAHLLRAPAVRHRGVVQVGAGERLRRSRRPKQQTRWRLHLFRLKRKVWSLLTGCNLTRANCRGCNSVGRRGRGHKRGRC